MFLKMAERVPGGRIMFFGLPVALFLISYTILSLNTLIQVCNNVTLAVSVAVSWSWRNSISTFMEEREDVGLVWLSLGVFTIIVFTVVNIAYSSWLRSTGMSITTYDSTITALVRFAYSFGFGCLYLVPMSKEDVVPPRGWVSLMCIVFGTAGLTLLARWWF
jgi:hypothetical protein